MTVFFGALDPMVNCELSSDHGVNEVYLVGRLLPLLYVGLVSLDRNVAMQSPDRPLLHVFDSMGSPAAIDRQRRPSD